MTEQDVRRHKMVLYRVGQVILVLWLAWKFVGVLPLFHSNGVAGAIGGYIGGNLFDVRTWLLAVGLLLLRSKIRKEQQAAIVRPPPN